MRNLSRLNDKQQNIARAVGFIVILVALSCAVVLMSQATRIETVPNNCDEEQSFITQGVMKCSEGKQFIHVYRTAGQTYVKCCEKE